MNKAIFLDRDGVINREYNRGYTYTVEAFIINDDVMQALTVFKQRGYKLILITNQSGISKDIYKHEDVVKTHNYLIDELKKHALQLDAIYYCPHHPDFDGNCLCRKPDSGMLEKAMARFEIDPQQSYFIGDAKRDIEAGKKAGLQTIFIESNAPLMPLLDQIK
jgi:D-glycero-D-manno-heptose 1,7-bisphosphate phosphatase